MIPTAPDRHPLRSRTGRPVELRPVGPVRLKAA
ncbi:MAG: hypothetical protein K0R87_2110 [Pseudonocardia sp.]|nr:hypothetical protein [Pseudonocardia sp.]